jgi:hypothetical protein
MIQITSQLTIFMGIFFGITHFLQKFSLGEFWIMASLSSLNIEQVIRRISLAWTALVVELSGKGHNKQVLLNIYKKLQCLFALFYAELPSNVFSHCFRRSS